MNRHCTTQPKKKITNLSAYCTFLKRTWNTMSYCFNLYQNFTPSNTYPYKVLLIQDWNFSMCYETHKHYLHQTKENYEIKTFKHVLNMQLTTGIAYTCIYCIYIYIYIYIYNSSRNYDFLLSFIYILFSVQFYKANCHILILHLRTWTEVSCFTFGLGYSTCIASKQFKAQACAYWTSTPSYQCWGQYCTLYCVKNITRNPR